VSTKLVFDTSALISLSLAETLHLVDRLGFEVLVPPTVFSELKETSAYDDDVAIATRRALSFVKECV
jgi:predicted ribonuclease YlaK